MPICIILNNKARIHDATVKSNNWEQIAATGKTILGKFIFVTRFAFCTKLNVEKRMEETKKPHGIALTETAAMSEKPMGLFETIEMPNLTTIPAKIMTIGINIAHKTPMMDCL